MEESPNQKIEESPNQRFPATAINIGDCLDDRYQIIEVLGQGGMGTVYKAMHLSLNKPVAIKALHAHIVLDKNANARFQQEIKAMSLLSHPHLISVSDVGTTKSGTPYFVMEFLDGPSLGDVLKKHGAPPDLRAIRMFIQMADALAYAHDRAIIHRDLKPNNIVVLTNRDKDFIKLVDLGIAKLLSSSTDEQGLTVTGEIFGSPLYMSPEQCSGKQVDARSDIYSLGCMMYETICGEPPIRGGSALETFMLHLNTEAPLISACPSVRMTPALKLLEPIISRCMQKKPDDRFQKMSELAHELEGIEKASFAPADLASAPLSASSKSNLNRGGVASPTNIAENARAIAPTAMVSSGSDASSTKSNAMKFSLSCLIIVVLGLTVAYLLGGLTMSNRATPDTPKVLVPSQVPSMPPMPNSGALLPSQHYNVTYPAADSSKTEVDVVAVYMGKDQEANNYMLPGTVKEQVNETKKPVTLVLASYCPTNWIIQRANAGVKIDRVMASSYLSPITVVGVPPGVRLEKAWYQYLDENGSKLDKARQNPFEFFTPGTSLMPDTPGFEHTSDYMTLKKIVESHLGQPIKSFQGAYQEGVFVVGN